MQFDLSPHARVFVKQMFELGEMFGFETRNKYRITDEHGREIGFAAEQGKGFLGTIMRQFFGHWRRYDVHFFGLDRQPFMTGRHPFRWFFQALEVRTPDGRMLGVVQRRWAILTKRFDVYGAGGQTVLEVSSPFWKPWTFAFRKQGREAARVQKKWSGLGFELFTDKDTFLVEYLDPNVAAEDRALVLAAAVYIDMMYFEQKGRGGVLSGD